jgi:hypothetical protein
MEQAVAEKTKTKILLKDGSTEKFKYIARENDQYYGARQTGNGLVNIRVDVDSISKVQVKNKTLSVLVTVIPLAAITAFMIAAANAWS